MNIKKYNHKKKPVFMYIHGECLSPYSFSTQVKELKKDFEIVLPFLDDTFISIQQSAEEIIQYIDNEYNGHIEVLAGFSLGGQIVAEILSRKNNICEFAIIEGALMYPIKLHNWSDIIASHLPMLSHNELFNSFMYYSKYNDAKAEKIYYQVMHHLNTQTVSNMYKELYNYTIPATMNDMSGKLAILVGTREGREYRKSADILHKRMDNSEIFMLMKYCHGGLSLDHPEEYIRFIKSWVQEKDKQSRIQSEKKKKEQEFEYMPNWKHLLNLYKSKKESMTTCK
ncbi:alpha/beta fold hydrolase [Absicoccus intestinalis]|uniref:Alpha/beta hydrolase n=1 Tax=Absicoccus intestinalis TaxID=2926319 RepID=A0ABU4WQ06_9FIRM|nr:alpha/beta hydrolase [Absicoccus sp. CLA-KB-P134]MDX8418136.1 alpha/beta hydrolase [Absicoccus sp. CLA-KB-P134]